MPKSGADFDSSQYAPVAERITLFYQRFPTGRIVTRLVSRRGEEITFMATVYRSPTEVEPAATGWASERIGDGEVNAVACLENAETSAVGRALANLGLTASRNRPSREEMAKADRHRARLARIRESDSRNVSYADDRLAKLADATLDTLRLLQTARRSGFDPARMVSMREKVQRGVSLASLERLESVLRHWLLRHASAGIPPGQTADVKDTPL